MNAVFHFSGEENQQAHAVANVRNLLSDDSAEVEEVVVVANGDGVSLLTDESEQADSVESLIADGVSFRACRNSMNGRGIAETDLLDGVETVPAGVGELVKRQEAGDAYVKTP